MENMPKNMSFKKWSPEIFEEKYTLVENEQKVEFYHVAGHTIGSSVAYYPSEKVLFAGDIFIAEPINFGLPFMGFYQNKPRKTGNPEEYLAAFARFKKMDINAIVPGHGDIIKNPQEYLDERITFFQSMKSLFVEAIKEGKDWEQVELRGLKPIERAFELVENEKPRYKARKFIDNYLHWIKKSFYNYYSGKLDESP